MPYKSNLELFSPVALAYLMDAPKPQTALDGHVPVSVLEQLKTAGMIKSRMLRHGSMATAWWYMADEETPALKVPPRATLPSCDDPDLFDGLPDESSGSLP
jgi:hypothetical protein